VAWVVEAQDLAFDFVAPGRGAGFAGAERGPDGAEVLNAGVSGASAENVGWDSPRGFLDATVWCEAQCLPMEDMPSRPYPHSPFLQWWERSKVVTGAFLGGSGV
jgi:hypothetical protein